jgi:hypothetical protein
LRLGRCLQNPSSCDTLASLQVAGWHVSPRLFQQRTGAWSLSAMHARLCTRDCRIPSLSWVMCDDSTRGFHLEARSDALGAYQRSALRRVPHMAEIRHTVVETSFDLPGRMVGRRDPVHRIAGRVSLWLDDVASVLRPGWCAKEPTYTTTHRWSGRTTIGVRQTCAEWPEDFSLGLALSAPS